MYEAAFAPASLVRQVGVEIGGRGGFVAMQACFQALVFLVTTSAYTAIQNGMVAEDPDGEESEDEALPLLKSQVPEFISLIKFRVNKAWDGVHGWRA